jgi:hypothetical protein
MTQAPMAAPKPADPAKTAAITLVVAAVLILIGTVSKNWISGGGGSRDVHVGPLGAEACFESRCVEIPTRGIPGDIEAIMMIAMLSGFASAAAAGLFGGMSLAGKSDRIPVPPKVAQICFGVAAFSMTFFLIRMLSEKGDLSWAGFPAIAGVILAGVGIKKLKPFLHAATERAVFIAQPTMPSMNPHNPQSSQPMQPPPQQAAVPNCPRCGTQLHFVAQYQRWFCPREQQYV